eukprot:m.466858 g.466858  ORF g.466858 m.466858 type:complete len:400 (+) comp25614_c0_seq1:42-1241(+)
MWLSPKLSPTQDPIPGLQTTEAVEQGEVLFTCKLEETLSTLTVHKSEWVKIIGGRSRAIKSVHLLTIYLLEVLSSRTQPESGDDTLQSFAWLKELPPRGSSQIMTGLDFSAAVAAAARRTRDGAEQLDALLRDAAAAWAEVNAALTEVGISEDDFRYGLSIVLSRSFEVEINGDQHHALVPAGDALNHCVCDASSSVRFVDGEFRVVAPVPAQSGGHVYITYGPKSNLELLIGYGFALDNNVHDVATINPPPSGPAPAPPTGSMSLLQLAMSCGPAAGFASGLGGGAVSGAVGGGALQPSHLYPLGAPRIRLGWRDKVGGEVFCLDEMQLQSLFCSTDDDGSAAILAFRKACTDALPVNEVLTVDDAAPPGLQAAHIANEGYALLLRAAHDQAETLLST